MKGYRIAINMIKQTKILKFIIPIVVFILLYAVSTIRNNNVRKDGIYSIVTLIKYGSAYRGQSAKYEFIYNKTLYKGSFFISFAESKNTPIGTRYFVTFLAQAPDRHLILDSVPSWFTLKAPDKGWKTLPTQKQLRIMMKDSLN